MNCTANIKNGKISRRCEREIGHPGLHRFTNRDGNIQEFSDSKCWFPWYAPEPKVQSGPRRSAYLRTREELGIPSGETTVIAADTSKKKFIDIVFDGPPANRSGRFVDVEDPDGRGLSVGKWVERDDGYWVLRIPATEEKEE